MELASDNPMLPLWLVQQGLGHHPGPPTAHLLPAMYPPSAAPVQLAEPPMLSATSALITHVPSNGLSQPAVHPLTAAANPTPFSVAAAAAAAASAQAVVSLNTRLALSHPSLYPAALQPSAPASPLLPMHGAAAAARASAPLLGQYALPQHPAAAAAAAAPPSLHDQVALAVTQPEAPQVRIASGNARASSSA